MKHLEALEFQLFNFRGFDKFSERCDVLDILKNKFIDFKNYLFRQEMERQRLAEWEETRKEELKQHRMREQEKVLTLKAKQEHMTNDLETLREKVKVKIILILFL